MISSAAILGKVRILIRTEICRLSQRTVATLPGYDVAQFCTELPSNVSGKMLPLSSGRIEDIRSKLHQKVLPLHQSGS